MDVKSTDYNYIPPPLPINRYIHGPYCRTTFSWALPPLQGVGVADTGIPDTGHGVS